MRGLRASTVWLRNISLHHLRTMTTEALSAGKVIDGTTLAKFLYLLRLVISWLDLDLLGQFAMASRPALNPCSPHTLVSSPNWLYCKLANVLTQLFMSV